jgi:hypothetical protein
MMMQDQQRDLSRQLALQMQQIQQAGLMQQLYSPDLLDRLRKEDIMRVLFIGGSLDGQWRAVPDLRPEYKAVKQRALGVYMDPLRQDAPAFESEVYHIVKVGKQETSVYLHESIDKEDLADHLVAGYKGAMENRYGSD